METDGQKGKERKDAKKEKMTDRADEAKQLIKDYNFVFTSEEGKRVLENLRGLSNMDHSVIPRDQQGRIDPMAVVRSEGQRSVVVHIYRKLGKDPYEERQKVAKGS